jgi:carbonic anhydrase
MVDEAINHHQATLMLTFPKHLIAGYRDFAAHRLPAEQSRYRELSVHGQSPETMLIGCCDSRVAPETIFDAGPGELFVMRNVANLVPPYAPDGEAHGVSAALEFAVQVLRVKHIVVMGHAQCGGVKALVEDSVPLSPGDFIGRWMSLIEPDSDKLKKRTDESKEMFVTRLEKAVVLRSLQNLMTFPCIRILVERGSLQLHGAYFGVAKGDLYILDKATGEFRSTQEATAA